MTGWRKETGETSGPNSILSVLSASHVSEAQSSRASLSGPSGLREVVGAVETGVTQVFDGQAQPLPAVPADAVLTLDHDRDFEHRTSPLIECYGRPILRS
jgi:hypothetical protein